LDSEPDNPCDKNAVALNCQADENAECERIDYVVREVASEVLGAINAKKILDATFAWIKYQDSR